LNFSLLDFTHEGQLSQYDFDRILRETVGQKENAHKIAAGVGLVVEGYEAVAACFEVV
jgi:hypothetical protein